MCVSNAYQVSWSVGKVRGPSGGTARYEQICSRRAGVDGVAVSHASCVVAPHTGAVGFAVEFPQGALLYLWK